VYDLLSKLNGASDANSSSMMKSHKTKAYNNLQVANLLVSNLSKMLNQTNPLNNISFEDKLNKTNSHKMKSKTLNEIIGEQMLEQFDWLKAAFKDEASANSKSNAESQSPEFINDNENINFIDSLDKLEKLITRIKLNRLTTLGRLFQAVNTSEQNVLLNVCNKCTGHLYWI
jgi:hypothetical protein